jgi:hypothetical protein
MPTKPGRFVLGVEPRWSQCRLLPWATLRLPLSGWAFDVATLPERVYLGSTRVGNQTKAPGAHTEALHRFAVTQRDLFPYSYHRWRGARRTLRRLLIRPTFASRIITSSVLSSSIFFIR